jgi:hypothetical protein
MSLTDLVKRNPVLRSVALPMYRAKVLSGYLYPPVREGVRWLLHSRETTNFTYDLTGKNRGYLCSMLAVATGIPASDFASYMAELETDDRLRDHVMKTTSGSALAYKADPLARFHKRLGWYALVRAMKPRIVVETGVDKGLGAVVLCAALLRNRSAGHAGRYFGTDLNPEAGYLLCGEYRSVGEILYGDSLESLQSMREPIDLFINDSDHSAAYEAAEYEAVLPLLAPGGIILGDNAHVTPELLDFSTRHGRSFLFWKEEPAAHWYPGGGIGLSFTPA